MPNGVERRWQRTACTESAQVLQGAGPLRAPPNLTHPKLRPQSRPGGPPPPRAPPRPRAPKSAPPAVAAPARLARGRRALGAARLLGRATPLGRARLLGGATPLGRARMLGRATPLGRATRLWSSRGGGPALSPHPFRPRPTPRESPPVSAASGLAASRMFSELGPAVRASGFLEKGKPASAASGPAFKTNTARKVRQKRRKKKKTEQNRNFFFPWRRRGGPARAGRGGGGGGTAGKGTHGMPEVCTAVTALQSLQEVR